MMALGGGRLRQRAGELDLSLCLLFNRGGRRSAVQRLFAVASRLGNGVAWYALMAALPLSYGAAGLASALHMAAVGVVGVLLYRLMKKHFNRERPFVNHPQIRLGTMPLDRFSFPSGHTLHAVAFTWVALHHHPSLALVLIPFTLLVATSRMVLGLHYPSDVVMGALVGAGLATGSLFFL
jgi:undecaprenyl-diphosphatase